MTLFAYSLRESFDGDNPWVRRLSGVGAPRAGRSQRIGTTAFFALAAALAIAWTAALAFDLRPFATTLAIVSYTCAAFLALASPAMGAAARGAVDNDSCLSESLASPLPDRAYVAALHGRALATAATAMAVFGVVAAAVGVALLDPVPKEAFNPPPYILHLYFKCLGFADIPSLSPAPVVLAGACCAAATACFAAGVYLRATLLAGVCNLSPTARSRGGALTVALVALVPVSMGLRLGVAWSALAPPGAELAAHIAFIAVVETAWTAGRLHIARRTWRRVEREGMAETRRYALGE